MWECCEGAIMLRQLHCWLVNHVMFMTRDIQKTFISAVIVCAHAIVLALCENSLSCARVFFVCQRGICLQPQWQTSWPLMRWSTVASGTALLCAPSSTTPSGSEVLTNALCVSLCVRACITSGRFVCMLRCVWCKFLFFIPVYLHLRSFRKHICCWCCQSNTLSVCLHYLGACRINKCVSSRGAESAGWQLYVQVTEHGAVKLTSPWQKGRFTSWSVYSQS